nr:histidine phosphatase family protein [Micromonospora sp. DSM 115978]
MAVEIIYETHSLTVDNEQGIATGWLPGELSTRGRLLAAELGARRRDTGIAAVFTSDLLRAVETARIAFAGTAIPIIQDRRLRECDYGELNGRPVAELTADRGRRVDEPFPGGQSYREVVVATEEFLREVARDRDGQRVLVIAHSANKWALDCLLGGAVLEEVIHAPFGWREGWTYLLPTGWVGLNGGRPEVGPEQPESITTPSQA